MKGDDDMKVSDFIQFDILKDGQILAGQNGLNNEILNATLIDAPDGYKLCTYGNFVLSTGFPFIDKQGWEIGMLKFLKVLVKKQCTGLGIKMGRYIPYLTDEIISFADKHKFPIISIPLHLKWSEIIISIINGVNKPNHYKLEMNQNIYTAFHNHLKKKESLEKLAQLLESIVESPVTIYIRKQNKKIDSQENLLDISEIEKVISKTSYHQYHKVQQLKKLNKDMLVRWIINTEQDFLEGAIIIWKNYLQMETWERIALEQAAVITALEIEKHRSISDSLQKLKNDFLLKLVSTDIMPEATINSLANEVNWVINEHNKVVLLEWDIRRSVDKHETNIWMEKSSILEEIKNSLKLSGFENIPFGFDNKNRFLLLIPENINQDKVFEIISQTINRLNITSLYAGVGKLTEIDNLHSSYDQANTALKVAYNKYLSNPNNKLYLKFFDDLHIERILFSSNPKEEAMNFAKHLNEIIEYDNSRNGELMTTLKTFLASNCNFDDTAAELYIHKNTVRYRINMIHKLTDLNPIKIKDQLILYLALTALETQTLK